MPYHYNEEQEHRLGVSHAADTHLSASQCRMLSHRQLGCHWLLSSVSVCAGWGKAAFIVPLPAQASARGDGTSGTCIMLLLSVPP